MMIDTTVYMLPARFTFPIDPLEQIFDQISEKSAVLNGLVFDFEISGFFDGTVYFLINQILFDNIASLISGNAWIEVETSEELQSVTEDGVKFFKFISNFIYSNNFMIFLLDYQLKLGIIKVAYDEFQFNIEDIQ